MVNDELLRKPVSDRDFVWKALEPMVEYAIEFASDRYKVNAAQHRLKVFRIKSGRDEWIFCGRDCVPGDDYRRFYAGSGAFALRLDEATPVIMAEHTIPIVRLKQQTTFARLQVHCDVSPFLGSDYDGRVDRGFLIRLAHFAGDPRYADEPKPLSSVSVYTQDDRYDWTPVVEFYDPRKQFAKAVTDITGRDYRQIDAYMKESGLSSWRFGQGSIGFDVHTFTKATEETALGLLDAIANEHLGGHHSSLASVANVVELEMRHSTS